MFRTTSFAFALASAGFVLGCGSGDSEPEQSAGSENIGSAVFELKQVPDGVGCIRITVSSAEVVTKDFPVAAGAATASLNMDRLPLGAAAIDSSAFETSCGTGSPTYVADTETTLFRPGFVATLALTFRKNNPVVASANFVGNVQKLSFGSDVTYALIDGKVYGWGIGGNKSGPINALTDVIDIAADRTSTSCAVKSDGSIWCWGNNSSGQVGVATPTTIPGNSPVRFGTETGFTSVSVGRRVVCGVKAASRDVKCSGADTNGELGNGADPASVPPVTIASGVSAPLSVSLSAGFGVGLTGNLRVMTWGDNAYGQLGDGTTTSKNAPTALMTPQAVVQIAAGFRHGCAVLADRTLQCWGDTSLGQLGILGPPRPTPVTVPGLSNVVSVHVGDGHSCALLASGAVQCWGDNSGGQLGDGTMIQRLTPVTVAVPGKVRLLAAGAFSMCAVTENEAIYCWGGNTYGQLGDATFVSALKPVEVTLP